MYWCLFYLYLYQMLQQDCSQMPRYEVLSKAAYRNYRLYEKKNNLYKFYKSFIVSINNLLLVYFVLCVVFVQAKEANFESVMSIWMVNCKFGFTIYWFHSGDVISIYTCFYPIQLLYSIYFQTKYLHFFLILLYLYYY